jgi:hypothetical protein
VPLIAPVLDDRSFEELFEELKNRIPVYTPEWTDYHDSDVGITLLQLFAYLGEGLQFRFNQIPEATYVAYLKLLDLPMRPARPAHALVRFENKAQAGAQLYSGDQVKAGKVVFTLTQDAVVWALDCVAVARTSVLSDDDLTDPQKVRAWIEGLEDDTVRTAVQGSVDAVRLSKPGTTVAVAPYEVRTMKSDGSDGPIDFANTVDHCVWIAVLAPEDPPIALADIADPVKGLQRPDGRTFALSIGFAPAATFPGIDEAPACGDGAGPSLIWQASLAPEPGDAEPRYTPVRVAGDTTLGFTREGVLRLELPADLSAFGVPAATDGLDGTGDFPPALDDDRAERVWFWLRVWRSDGSRIGSTRLLTLNAVPCEQAAAATPQLLGTGDGQPDQVYTLAKRPVLVDALHPVKVQVEEQGVWTDWTRVDNFDDSREPDRHFTVDAEAGTVRFGSAVPELRQRLRVPQLGERIRVTAYSVGGGAAGNVPANAIAKLADARPDAPAPTAPLVRAGGTLKIANPLAVLDGADGESIDEALRRIPTELRRNRRAVAKDDFSSLAMETPNVKLGRAECMPLFHAPSRTRRPGTVSVVVWPQEDPQHPRAPLPDSWQLRQVCEWLDRWRLVTTELYVIPPTYRRIALSVSVKVRDGYGLDAVRDWVEALLRNYLGPLPTNGPEGEGWPLGRRVIARELEGVAMQVEGVEYVQAFRLDAVSTVAGGKDTWIPAEVLELADWEVPEVAAVTVVDDATALPAPGTGLSPPPTRRPVPVPAPRTEC